MNSTYLDAPRLAALALALGLAACGSSSSDVSSGADAGPPLTCGAGTRLDGDACVPIAGPACAAGTNLRDGACVADAAPTCAAGTVQSGGRCVPAPAPACAEGTRLEGSACVPAPLVLCGAGTHEATGGACVPDVACGAGTVAFMGACVPADPDPAVAPATTATPAPGLYLAPQRVTLQTDKPARIHFTVDGSEPTLASPSEPAPVVLANVGAGGVTTTVRYFAVGPGGTAEAAHTAEYRVDLAAPAPATGARVTASEDGATATLTWTNPLDADLAGVVVTRRAGAPPEHPPAPGATVAAGDALGDGETVVFVGAGTEAAGLALAPGLTFFAVWTRDAAGRPSPTAARAFALRRHGAQTGALELLLGETPSASVTADPPLLHVTVGAPELGEGTVRVEVTVESAVARPLFGLKLVARSVSAGTLGEAPTMDGGPYVAFGPDALGPGEPRTRVLELTGLPAETATVTVEFELRDDPTLYVGGRYNIHGGASTFDLGAGRGAGTLGCDRFVSGSSNGNCSWRPGVMSPDGRYIYAGNRSRPIVRRVPTTDHGATLALELAPFGFVGPVVWLPGGRTLLALLHTNGHSYAFGDRSRRGALYLVWIDAETFTETDRLLVLEDGGPATADDEEPSHDARVRALALSPDGQLVAIPIFARGQLAFVDLATRALVDTDAETPAVDLVALRPTPEDPSALANPRALAFSPDGARLFVGYGRSNVDRLTIVTMADFSLSALPFTNGESARPVRVNGLAFDPTGRLWLSTSDGSPITAGAVVDFSGEVPATTWLDGARAGGFGFSADALLLSPDGARAWFTSKSPQAVVAVDTTTLLPVDADGLVPEETAPDAYGPLGTTPGSHFLLVSPY